MPVLVGFLLLVIVLLIGGALLGVALNLIWYLLVGLVIGALARLIVPNTGGMGLLATSLYGIAGSLIGGMVADKVLDWGLFGSLVLSVAAAALLVAALGSLGARDESSRRGA